MEKKRLLGWFGAGAVLAAVVICGAYLVPDLRPPSANYALTLKDMNGRDVPGAVQGKAARRNFWATWCGPCLLEAPELVELAEVRPGQHHRRSTDDTPELIRECASAHKIGYLLVGRDREMWPGVRARGRHSDDRVRQGRRHDREPAERDQYEGMVRTDGLLF